MIFKKKVLQKLFKNYLCTFLIVGLVLVLFYFLDSECNSNETETLTTTTTTVTIGPQPNCNFSIGTNNSENGSITGLIPGTVYQIFLNCLNCCKEVATSKSVFSLLQSHVWLLFVRVLSVWMNHQLHTWLYCLLLFSPTQYRSHRAWSSQWPQWVSNHTIHSVSYLDGTRGKEVLL